MGIIYKIVNPINEVYVGSTKRRNLSNRKAEHKYQSKEGRKNLICDSFRRYGFGNHTFNIVAKDVDNNDLIELEHFIIQEFEPKLNMVLKHNNTAQGKIWVNDSHKEFQILPKFFNDYKNIEKGRLINKT